MVLQSRFRECFVVVVDLVLVLLGLVEEFGLLLWLFGDILVKFDVWIVENYENFLDEYEYYDLFL